MVCCCYPTTPTISKAVMSALDDFLNEFNIRKNKVCFSSALHYQILYLNQKWFYTVGKIFHGLNILILAASSSIWLQRCCPSPSAWASQLTQTHIPQVGNLLHEIKSWVDPRICVSTSGRNILLCSCRSQHTTAKALFIAVCMSVAHVS